MSSFSFNLEPTVDLARQPCEARVTRHSRTLEYQPLRLEFLKELPKFVDTVIGDIEEKLREYFKLDVITQTLKARTFGEQRYKYQCVIVILRIKYRLNNLVCSIVIFNMSPIRINTCTRL